MITHQCRLCRDNSLYVGLTINNSPRNIQTLFNAPHLPGSDSQNLELLVCKSCGFIQLEYSLSEEYYDDYIMATTHSPQMQRYQEQQARDFIGRFNLQNKKVLEVGCGDGSYLTHLQSAGAIVTGVEPSASFRDLAISKSFCVEGTYISETSLLADAPFDAFVTRQVLEHVPDIHDFLKGIRNNLSDSAKGLIEVPSLEKALADERFYDFFPDHVNYFSIQTLSMALNMNGFTVIDTCSGMNSEYNIAFVEKSETSKSLTALGNSVKTVTSALKELIYSHTTNGGNVIVWGAGGKGLASMAVAQIDSINMVVDSDPYKQGMYTPVLHLRVEHPNHILELNPSLVIITALAYASEITTQLRDEMHYQGDIYYLDQHVTSR